MGLHLITGGSSGIGQALAWELASRGESVMVIGRRQDALAETAAKFPEAIQIYPADVTIECQSESIMQALNGVKLASLTHSAGSIDPIIELKNISYNDWRSNFAINLDAPLMLSQRCYSQLKGGRVLHVSSGAAHHAFPGWSAYCSSKAALHMLYQCWNAEQSDVAFGSVMPGIVDTDMQAIIRANQEMPQERQDFFIQLKNKRQLLSPETVAKFLAWLLLDIDKQQFSQKDWDIYDKSHHKTWLPETLNVPEIF